MDYVEQTCGVTFDQSGFIYGNLKPDLTGTYLTKRHNPSIMMDEVMEKSALLRTSIPSGVPRTRAVGRSRRDLPLHDRLFHLPAQRRYL